MPDQPEHRTRRGWRHSIPPDRRVATWAAARLTRGRYPVTAAAVLYADFAAWCEEHDAHRVAANIWGQSLTTLGFERRRSNGSFWDAELIPGRAGG